MEGVQSRLLNKVSGPWDQVERGRATRGRGGCVPGDGGAGRGGGGRGETPPRYSDADTVTRVSWAEAE